MILLYEGNDAGQAALARRVLDENGIEYSLVTDRHKNTPLATLIQEKKEEKDGETTEPLFLFYNDLDRKLLGQVDAQMKDLGVNTSRKCLATPNNLTWNLGALMQEVGEEAHWFELREKLFNLVANPDRERLQKDPAYMEAMVKGFALVENEEPTIAQMEQAIKDIESFN